MELFQQSAIGLGHKIYDQKNAGSYKDMSCNAWKKSSIFCIEQNGFEADANLRNYAIQVGVEWQSKMADMEIS